jgi:hypothetical protein
MEPPVRGDRPDPIDLLLAQEQGRLDWLLPVRHSRMAESAFTFYRGAAAVMAADLAREPHSELMVQLCGDAHLLNFGFYGSPERQLLFDINDFDETHPGPFEWDVVRLATSLLLAARSLGLGEKRQSKVSRRWVQAYAEAMHRLSAMPFMAMWVARLPPDELIDHRASPAAVCGPILSRSPLRRCSATADRRCASCASATAPASSSFAMIRRCSGALRSSGQRSWRDGLAPAGLDHFFRPPRQHSAGDEAVPLQLQASGFRD